MPKVLSKREKIIFYITVSIVVIGLAFNFIIAPILNKNDEINKELNLASAKLMKYMRLLSQKDLIQNKYKDFSAAFKVSDKKENRMVEALSALEALAKGANMRIIDLRPQGASRGALSGYKEALIDLKTEGSMENYLKFIYDLESSLSLLRIKKFQLNSKSNSQNLEGTFSISQLSLSE